MPTNFRARGAEAAAAALVGALLFLTPPAGAAAASHPESQRGAVRPIKVLAFGALTGPARSFGTNSRAALTAAAGKINAAGGMHLADGSTGVFDITYQDDHCNAEDGIDIVRHAASSDDIVVIGPSCSAVAEAVYHTLQRTVDDSADAGIEIPLFTDGAMKANLTQVSQWAFRNTPNETDMYTVLWKWVRERHPGLRTVYGGMEGDFAHSHSTWSNIISATASQAGLSVVGETSWSLNDTAFATAVGQMKSARADVIVISGHAATTCGVLHELAVQGVHPQLLVGLTSSATAETLAKCGPEAEGLLIPTSFFAHDSRSLTASRAVERAGGIADLHSMAAWEILQTLSHVIEQCGVVGDPVSVAADRRKLRDGLARLTGMDGLMGPIGRSADREARKPFVLVQAQHSSWQVVYSPETVIAVTRRTVLP